MMHSIGQHLCSLAQKRPRTVSRVCSNAAPPAFTSAWIDASLCVLGTWKAHPADPDMVAGRHSLWFRSAQDPDTNPLRSASPHSDAPLCVPQSYVQLRFRLPISTNGLRSGHALSTYQHATRARSQSAGHWREYALQRLNLPSRDLGWDCISFFKDGYWHICKTFEC